eukprot:scaffold5846_cov333-Prasinococcus_capsulatus_cf.AAC.4
MRGGPAQDLSASTAPTSPGAGDTAAPTPVPCASRGRQRVTGMRAVMALASGITCCDRRSIDGRGVPDPAVSAPGGRCTPVRLWWRRHPCGPGGPGRSESDADLRSILSYLIQLWSSYWPTEESIVSDTKPPQRVHGISRSVGDGGARRSVRTDHHPVDTDTPSRRDTAARSALEPAHALDARLAYRSSSSCSRRLRGGGPEGARQPASRGCGGLLRLVRCPWAK